MTNQTISRYLGYAQSDNSKYILSKQQLSLDVNLSRGILIGHESPINEADFYFLEDLFGNVYGVVYDMIDDLHAYVTMKHRKTGKLMDALQTVIIPDIQKKRPWRPVVVTPDRILHAGMLEQLGFMLDGRKYVLEHQGA